MIIDAIRYTLQNPDGVFWKENDYHKQKELELRNPILSSTDTPVDWAVLLKKENQEK
jgi:hypothetical protein